MDLLNHNYQLFAFEARQIPELLSWIKTPSDLGYWAGNTFKEGLSPLIFAIPLFPDDVIHFNDVLLDSIQQASPFFTTNHFKSQSCIACKSRVIGA